MKKDSCRIWESPQKVAFQELIQLASNPPTLKCFELHKPETQYGSGACLMQDGEPVAYTSKAMTKTERAYAQIDKESLAIVFGFSKLEQYLLGNFNITVETNHRPLE